MSLLPSNRKCKALYLQCRKKYSPGNWFHDAPVGENRMRSFVKELCLKAGIPGFYTNHSLRSTSCTRMYDCDVDEQVIQEISGHRSLSVRSYKRTSDEKRRKATKSILESANECHCNENGELIHMYLKSVRPVESFDMLLGNFCRNFLTFCKFIKFIKFSKCIQKCCYCSLSCVRQK